jgi:tRNA A37 threonylcarbamoyladenosine dehydratase
MVRKRLRQQGVTGDFPCVYSEEFPSENRGRTFCGSPVCACPDKDEENLCLAKARINGTLAHVTGTFGFALAGLVIQDVAVQCGWVPPTGGHSGAEAIHSE